MQPVTNKTIEEILASIKDYQSRSVSSPSGLTPIEVIIHGSATLQKFAIEFQAICDALAAKIPPPAKFSWQLGMFPFTDECKDGKFRMGMYFIPILCKEGYESKNPGDPDFADYIMDFMDANVRSTYYNTDKVYVYDFGGLYP